MTTVLEATRTAIMSANAEREERKGYPDRSALEAMRIKDLREYVADCARDHGAQCVMVGQCHTSSAWLRFRMALDVLSKRGGA